MKPFILRFIDFKPTSTTIDDMVEYSDELNLNVLSSISVPAVDVLNIRGETFTKADQDPTDNTRGLYLSKLRNTIESATITLSREETDVNNNLVSVFFDCLKGKTITESNEVVDVPKFKSLISAIGGMTNTRDHIESTDVK